MKNSNRKLLESVADIAYIAGVQKYYSEDSRADISDFIWWASQFQQLHKSTDWTTENYMLAIEMFVNNKLQAAKVS